MRHMCTAILCGASALLFAACAGGSAARSNGSSTTAATSAKADAPKALAANGSALFTKNCSSCHQTNGKGSPGAFPPLAGNPVVTGSAKNVIHIVKNGLTGTIKVGTSTFNGQMPAWKGTLSNGDIAAVITYIRSAWGNHASGVSAAQVAASP